ncbi:Fic family protein [Lactovum odontotermitis]
MNYQELKIAQYNNIANYEAEYKRRIDGIGTAKTELHPYVLEHRETVKSKYPLFSVPLPEIQLLSENITENSRQITGLAQSLPKVAHNQFYQEQLAKAIISTNEIEGVHTTRKEVHDAFESLVKPGKKKVRLQSTLQMYQDILGSEDIRIDSLKDIRKLYDKLTEGEIERENLPDGVLFRNCTVQVGRKHTPPKTEHEIYLQLSSWLNFINDHQFTFLIRAALGHFFFENTHPFIDGNGRLGRYIFSRYLSRKLDKFSGLVISQKIVENRRKYELAFENAELAANRSEGTFFVKMMLEYVNDGQSEIIQVLKEKQNALKTVEKILQADKSFTSEEKYVLHLLYQSFLFTDRPEEAITDNAIIELAKATEFSGRSIQSALKKLEDDNIIQLVTQRPKRHTIVTPLVD